MILKPKFTPAQVGQILQKKVAQIDSAVLSALSRIGEAYVTRARSVNTYTDRTGNLRSSIGYVVLKDGQQVYGGLPGGEAAGKAKGRAALERAKQQHSRGWVLIVVAGMEYAAAVEAKGKDVITVSSYPVAGDIRTAIERIKNKLS